MTRDHPDGMDALAARLRAFASDRDWDQFHTPKNLAMALSGEVGELVAELQWLTPEQSASVMDDAEAAERLRGEIADVLIYLVRLCDVLGVDPVAAAQAKVDVGERRYRAEEYRGRADKAPQLPR